MSIETGMLRQFINELGLSSFEKIVFVQKLDIIQNTENWINFQREKDRQKER